MLKFIIYTIIGIFVFHFILFNLNINILELYNKRREHYPTNEPINSFTENKEPTLENTLLDTNKLNEHIGELKDGINKLKNINNTILYNE